MQTASILAIGDVDRLSNRHRRDEGGIVHKIATIMGAGARVKEGGKGRIIGPVRDLQGGSRTAVVRISHIICTQGERQLGRARA